MGITYLGSATGVSANGTNATINLTPIGLQQGDIIVVIQSIGENYSDLLTAPSGFTKLSSAFNSDTYAINSTISYKIMGVTPDSSITLLGLDNWYSGSQSANAGIAYCFRGVDKTTPIDVTTVSAGGSNTGTPTPPGITTVTDGAMILSAACSSYYDSSPASSNLSNIIYVSQTDTLPVLCSIGNHLQSSAGSFTPIWSGFGGASAYAWNAFAVALRPEVSANGSSKFFQLF